MHLLLTDILTCPRCGPEHGLVLLAHDLRDRRVHEGWLGCPNCRARWVVHEGVGEFRAPLGERVADGAPAASAEGGSVDPLRVAALLGITEGPAFVLVAGGASAQARKVADLVEDLEVVAVDGPSEAEAAGVSRMSVADALPFYAARLRGVWLGGGAADALLEEGARVLGPLGRMVLDPAPVDAAARLEAKGLRILAAQDGTVVAARA